MVPGALLHLVQGRSTPTLPRAIACALKHADGEERAQSRLAPWKGRLPTVAFASRS